MKKAEIEIGACYIAKVSGKLKVIKIISESRFGGWDARSLKTERDVRIKSAARLRYRAEQNVAVRP